MDSSRFLQTKAPTLASLFIVLPESYPSLDPIFKKLLKYVTVCVYVCE